MAYINVGALAPTGPVKTKKQLKAEIDSIQFYDTSPLGQTFHGGWGDLADNFPAGTKLTVVGPDPFTDRKWYATVEVVNGKVKVT